jgi:EAL domain-containing protein (putative c-di-GMP-specific phosphodiesterase class I)/GGDEF domain-containing protein
MLEAGNDHDAGEIARREQFGQILRDKAISIVYQPVASLEDGKITGYEALTRGPENSYFNKPVNLFGYAEKTNQLYALEKLARQKALSGFGDNYKDKKIFINISPQVVNDPSFRIDELITYLAEIGASPQQVVFEITERTSIDDFCSFRDSLGYYRQYGFQVAVDDAGSGFSSLQAISELQPDFIKLDISLIRDIDHSPNKRSLVETLRTFSEKTGSIIIAEGIETAGELECLREIGVHLGQGFFLARPDNPCPALYPQAVSKLSGVYNPVLHKDRFGRMIPVGSISQSTAAMTINTLTSEMMKFFTNNPQVEGVAIVEDRKPVGLVMRDKLFNQLATQFGFAIYNERPIALVMDKQPFIVEVDTPVELVSQTALSRPNHKVYDSIIVIKNGIYLGLVSFRSLLDKITGMQIKAARFANPLTGLPGNLQIEEELLNRLNADQPFSIIYSDLDHFKSFNDCYGFERGDLVIQLAADIIKEVTAEEGKADDLVGHIGGDDYIIITRPDVAESICSGIIAAFEARVSDLYDPKDRARGYIDTRDRQDHPIRLPLMSISLAIINAQPKQYPSTEELARVAAELKKYAKSQKGSLYVIDRRSKHVF